jgi:cell division protein FtsB
MFSQKLLRSKIVFFVALLLVGYLCFSLTKQIALRKNSAAKIASIKKEIEGLNNKEEELLKLQNYYSSDEFLEKEARRILSYQKPGEEVYAVIPNKRNEKEISTNDELKIMEENSSIDKEVLNPIKWWNYFFNNIN